ncbi:gluconokinase [Nocardia amikacinitolerans]|uniref:gluconokinase n=1 Tax=Nocardia amikacinitolerans TaxID=756689 RepID=UPI0020A45305|nr:gluconokinase [Nocardia amikacinitolerans]
MGVSGTGKTTIARLLATRLGIPFADADDFHSPENVAKMSSGIPLDDSDRGPWLTAVGRWLHDHHTAGTGAVVACSALKRRYRDILRASAPSVFFLLLTAGREQLIERMTRRHGHYMPPSLLDSQLEALEPLQPSERGAVLPADSAPDHIAEAAAALFRKAAGAPEAG